MNRALPTLAVLILTAGGCSPTSIAKRGFKELKGASAKVFEVRPPRMADLQAYKSVRLGQAQNEIQQLCPPGMFSGMKTYVPAALTEIKDVFPGGEPALTVDVHIQYAQTGGGLKAALGSDQYLISRVFLRGQDTSPVGELVLVAHSEAMRTSELDMAKAAADGLADYLKSKLKKEEEDD